MSYTQKQGQYSLSRTSYLTPHPWQPVCLAGSADVRTTVSLASMAICQSGITGLVSVDVCQCGFMDVCLSVWPQWASVSLLLQVYVSEHPPGLE